MWMMCLNPRKQQPLRYMSDVLSNLALPMTFSLFQDEKCATLTNVKHILVQNVVMVVIIGHLLDIFRGFFFSATLDVGLSNNFY